MERRKRMKEGRKDDMRREIIEEQDMQQEEEEQRDYGDTFWGVDRQERDRRSSLRSMEREDHASRKREAREKLAMMHGRWSKELQQNHAEETLANATADLRRRGKCFFWLYFCSPCF